MHLRSGIVVLLAALAIPSVAGAGPQTPQELQTRFEQEPDVVRQAKLLIELSRTDFRVITEQVETGDNTDALKTLAQLADDVERCSKALDAREKNPESHSSGFKQLQIAARESLRRLDYLTVNLTADEQAPFLAIRKRLDVSNRHLIRELFPHQSLPPDPEAPDAGEPVQNQPEAKP